MNYEIIRNVVLEWYNKILSELNNNDIGVISKNREDVLIIDFDFGKCMAQLSVTNTKFVPYRYVYFEAVDIEMMNQENVKKIYCFYDNDSMKKSDIIDGLGKAVRFCLEYKK